VTDAFHTTWLIAEDAKEPSFGAGTSVTARPYFSPLLTTRGIYPAIDPLRSSSSLLAREIVGPEHFDVATQVRAGLQLLRDRATDSRFLEMVACGAYGSAKATTEAWTDELVSALPEPQRTLAQRARLLEAYLSQPCFCLARHTKVDGVTVPLETVLTDCQVILDGGCDELSPAHLYFGGSLAQLTRRGPLERKYL
jgi:F-type H+-transporting ATPase subunit beta